MAYILEMDPRDEKIRRFFDACMRIWERKHGRKPETMEEMREAIALGLESRCSEKPNSRGILGN